MNDVTSQINGFFSGFEKLWGLVGNLKERLGSITAAVGETFSVAKTNTNFWKLSLLETYVYLHAFVKTLVGIPGDFKKIGKNIIKGFRGIKTFFGFFKKGYSSIANLGKKVFSPTTNSGKAASVPMAKSGKAASGILGKGFKALGAVSSKALGGKLGKVFAPMAKLGKVAFGPLIKGFKALRVVSGNTFGSMAKSGGGIFGTLGKGFKALGSMAKSGVSSFGILGKGFGFLVRIFSAGFRLLTVLFVTNPIGLVLAAIALVIGLIITNWEYLSKAFSDGLSYVGSALGGFFSNIWDSIVQGILGFLPDWALSFLGIEPDEEKDSLQKENIAKEKPEKKSSFWPWSSSDDSSEEKPTPVVKALEEKKQETPTPVVKVLEEKKQEERQAVAKISSKNSKSSVKVRNTFHVKTKERVDVKHLAEQLSVMEEKKLRHTMVDYNRA